MWKVWLLTLRTSHLVTYVEDRKSTHQSSGDTEDCKSMIRDEINEYDHINPKFEEAKL